MSQSLDQCTQTSGYIRTRNRTRVEFGSNKQPSVGTGANAFPAGFDPKPAPYNVSFTGTACSEPKLIELAFALPEIKSKEVFVRLHHRCSLYDVLNNYGANGEDFLVLGYRRYF